MTSLDPVNTDLAPQKLSSLSDKYLFLTLIAVVTIFPIVFVSFVTPFRDSARSIDDIFRLLLLMSTMHVGLTAYFYLDSEYRSYTSQNVRFYVLLPAALILGCGLITSVYAEAGLIYLQLFYHAWLLFHYGRQNYGVLAFASIATDSGRPLNTERLALHLAPIGGILGAHGVFDQFGQSVFAPAQDLSIWLGAGCTIAAILLGLVSAIKHLFRKTSLWRPFFIILLSAFYVPTFFFDTYFQAILGYAIAHAIQYFVFMVFLSSGAPSKPPVRSIIVLISGMLAVWGLILITREQSIWGPVAPFITGAAVGLVMWHFVMDAGYWRLSQTWQRARVRERFAFLFEK